VVGALAFELNGQPGDLQLEVVDQRQADVDVASPRIGDGEPVEQLAAGVPERVGDRARMAEGDQRGVDAVLQRRAMADEVQPEAGRLALAAKGRVGQPDLGHQITARQRREHPGVDLVGLAGQRRQALDLVRVGDQHVPAVLFELVVNEPRAVHRLDHAADPRALHRGAGRQAAQPVGIGRRGPLVDDLPLVGDQTDVDLASTQIQSSVQHEDGPPRARSSVTR
jgi:hypothetical protein